MKSRQTLITGFGLAFGLLTLAGCGVFYNELYQDFLEQEIAAAEALNALDANNPSFLYTLTATDGALTADPNATSDFTLTLHGLIGSVITFSDRPERIADHEALADFVTAWETRGFASDPPNAALVLHEEDESQDIVIIELSEPSYDPNADTLTFAATVLHDEQTGALAEYGANADAALPETFGECSLLIDDASIGCAVKILVPQTSGSFLTFYAHTTTTHAGSTQTTSQSSSGGTLDLGTGVTSFRLTAQIGPVFHHTFTVTCPDDCQAYTISLLDFSSRSLPDGFTLK